MTRKELINEIICALLILLFIYASFSKLSNIQEFKHAMHLQPFPNWLKNVIVTTLPTIEIVVSIMIGFQKSRRIGLILFVGIMLLFTIYIAAILINWFHRVPCSCGGVIQQLGWRNHLIFNLLFIVIAICAIQKSSIKIQKIEQPTKMD